MAATIDLTPFRFAVSLVRKAFVDVRDEDLRLQPLPTMNPPIWILGHLVTVLAYIPTMFGKPLSCPREYLVWFGPGSRPEKLPAAPPTKDQLLSQLSQVSETILALIPTVPEVDWEKPNPTPFLQAELPTLRAITDNLLCNHTMLHVGQMTVWRRTQNLPSVISIPG